MSKAVQNTLDLIKEVDSVKAVYLIESAGKEPQTKYKSGEADKYKKITAELNKELLRKKNHQDETKNINEKNIRLTSTYLKNSGYYLIMVTDMSKSFDSPDNEKFQNYKTILNELLTKGIEDESNLAEENTNESESTKSKDSGIYSSEEKFRLLIETANDLIFNLDGFGYIVMVNDSGANNLGYSREDMMGQHFLDFIDDDSKDTTNLNFQKMLSSDEITSFDVDFKGKFGEKMIYEIQAKPVKKGNEITGLIGIGRDITQHRRDENKLKKLNTKLIETNRLLSVERDRVKHQVTVLEELNKLKNEFISNVSHELRTPLASIVGFAESIYSEPDMDRDTIHEFNEIILNEGKRLANLINDILDFSRLESEEDKLDKSNFDLLELFNEVTKSFKEAAFENGIELKTELPENEMPINADRERLYKVFENLLSNAVKFTNNGGSITLVAQEFSTEYEVIVSDTGVGIPEKELPKIFDKFSKINTKGSHQAGAGIGLTLVKQIIDLHKGIIRARSELDKGTSFIIRIPKK